MKKSLYSLIFPMLMCYFGHAQNKVDISAITTSSGTPSEKKVKNNDKIKVNRDVNVTQFDLTYSSLSSGQKLIVDCDGAALDAGITNDYTDPTKAKTFKFTSDISNKLITIKLDNGSRVVSDFLVFKFTKSAGGQEQGRTSAPERPDISQGLAKPLQNYLDGLLTYYKQTDFGFVDPNSDEEAVHIFFNQYGNSLLGTIPQGISNKQYVVHIIYLGYSDQPDDVDYSIRQKTGSFNSSLVLNNTGILNNVSNFQSSSDKGYDQWHEETFLLGTATDDITFDILATTENDEGKPVKFVLDTYTIKMSPVYHGSFDIGLLNSKLSSPSYTLIDIPSGATYKVVKESDGGSHGVVTIMATLYTSPIILLEKLGSRLGWVKKKIPNYKLSGRNFLDDHRLLERIYPAVGVSANSSAFENLFFGLNWEIARGLSVFGGKHYGKVNTFDMPSFVAGSTPVTEQQFVFYTDSKWKTNWAFGVNLDILIVTNLFKK